MRVLLLDNDDPFTRELYRALSSLGGTILIHRSDEIEVDEIQALAPDRIVISPGMGLPAEAGISLPLIRELGVAIPILGISLGHEAIGVAFGGRLISLPAPAEGTLVTIDHAGLGLFHGVASPLKASSHHSAVVERDSLPDSLEVTAQTRDGRIMALRHRTLPIEGIQFYPELQGDRPGLRLLSNFLESNGSPT